MQRLMARRGSAGTLESPEFSGAKGNTSRGQSTSTSRISSLRPRDRAASLHSPLRGRVLASHNSAAGPPTMIAASCIAATPRAACAAAPRPARSMRAAAARSGQVGAPASAPRTSMRKNDHQDAIRAGAGEHPRPSTRPRRALGSWLKVLALAAPGESAVVPASVDVPFADGRGIRRSNISASREPGGPSWPFPSGHASARFHPPPAGARRPVIAWDGLHALVRQAGQPSDAPSRACRPSHATRPPLTLARRKAPSRSLSASPRRR